MPVKNLGLYLAISIFIFFGLAPVVQAGFGVTSPYLENDLLIQGAHYQKKMEIVRSDPVEDWQAEITIEVPGANDWISIDKGNEFILPKGTTQVPIIVSVDVPPNAKLGRYQGVIRLRTVPVNAVGGVSIALGARINVDLEIVEGGFFDFKVERLRFLDIEEGWKVKLGMTIKNTGNVAVSPTKIYLEVYDSSEKNKLASLENDNLTDKVKPFETKELIATFANQLKPGAYPTYLKIFKKDELVKEGKLTLSVFPPGTLPPETPFGNFFSEIFNKEKLIIIISAVIFLIIFLLIVLKKIKKKKK